MVANVTKNLPPLVLTETQAKTLATLKAVAAAGRGVTAGQTAAEAAAAARIKLPGLLLAAGSAAATGDIRSAARVARETRILATSLRSGLDQGQATATETGATRPPALSPDQAKSLFKQLKLALVRAQIALVQPYGQPTDPSVRRAAENDIRSTERALAELEAKIRGGGGSKSKAIDIQAD
jgi:hypothetical protein